MHLAVDPGLYSVEDMVGVKKGTLVQFLEEVRYKSLLSFYSSVSALVHVVVSVTGVVFSRRG